jgi:hypothetical protein
VHIWNFSGTSSKPLSWDTYGYMPELPLAAAVITLFVLYIRMIS